MMKRIRREAEKKPLPVAKASKPMGIRLTNNYRYDILNFKRKTADFSNRNLLRASKKNTWNPCADTRWEIDPA